MRDKFNKSKHLLPQANLSGITTFPLLLQSSPNSSPVHSRFPSAPTTALSELSSYSMTAIRDCSRPAARRCGAEVREERTLRGWRDGLEESKEAKRLE